MKSRAHYLLDTNVCIGFLQGKAWAFDQFKKIGTHRLYLCSPVKAELWYGACKSQRVVENQENFRDFFTQLPSLPFDDAVVECIGSLRADLSKKGQLIGPYDMQIAAIAIVYDLVLVTHNVKEFARIPQLKIEDWEK
jgi:tRNA(fMet)-specific endonuclease VapC